MKRRLIITALALGVLFSFSACDIFGTLVNKQSEITTEAPESSETTEEATTTTEETTTEETTEATSEETTTTEETTSEETTTATPTPTKKPTKKPTKIPTKPTYIPKGWHKLSEVWGGKYKGYKAYVIYSDKNSDILKGWWKGKWVKLYSTSKTLHDYDKDDYYEALVTLYRDKKHKYKYASYTTD